VLAVPRTAKPPRILVADDSSFMRRLLTQALRDAGFDVVGEAADGDEAVAIATEQRPDVVLMDLSMPNVDGSEATRRLRQADDTIQVVVLTSFSDRERILDALDAGAVGYLLKDGEPAEVVAGIRAAARGGSPLDPRAARALIERGTARRTAVVLSDREREVLDLVAEGLANKQIARRLGISERTVKAHLTRVYAVIGVADRTSAALWAQRHR
jgi:DNA-binding NarL/FixJ family response regulator